MDLQHLRYQLRSGHYYLYDLRDAPNTITGERPYRLKMELVAIAFDRITGRVQQRLRGAGSSPQLRPRLRRSLEEPENEINQSH